MSADASIRNDMSVHEVPGHRRMLIALGPTAGHVHPALAFVDAYRLAFGQVDAHFVSVAGGPADALLASRADELHHVAGAPLVNVGMLAKWIAAQRVAQGVMQTGRLLRDYGIRLVIGFGGYASGGVLLAARMRGIPTVIHEANAIPGLANRLLAPFVDHAYLGWSAAMNGFDRRRCTVTGTPIRSSIAELATTQPPPPAMDRPARVLVLSGSWGAAFFSEHIPPLLAEVARRGRAVQVMHQSDESDTAALCHAYRQEGIDAAVTRTVSDMAEAYRWADFVVARGGAGTLAEISAAALPSLLVPLKMAAADHQRMNAQFYAERGASISIAESDWNTALLAERVALLLADRQAWTEASAASRSLAKPDSAQQLVAACEKLMVNRW